MPFIGNTTGTEMMEHRISHTGDGARTVFTVNYTDDSVSVYLNGVKMLHATDYTTNATGTNITFTQAPANGDVVDLVGLNFITDLARSSYLRETFTSTASQQHFTLNTNIDGTTRLNVHLNGYRLSEVDYTITPANNTISFTAGRTLNDVVAVDIISPGFRSSMHNAKGESAEHPMFLTPSTLNTDVTIATGKNGVLVGPVTVDANITINGTLTIV